MADSSELSVPPPTVASPVESKPRSVDVDELAPPSELSSSTAPDDTPSSIPLDDLDALAPTQQDTATTEAQPTGEGLSPEVVASALPSDLPSAHDGVLPPVELAPLEGTAESGNKGKGVDREEHAGVEERVGTLSLEGTPAPAPPPIAVPTEPEPQPAAAAVHSVPQPEVEEEWPLKEIPWPPLPPPPSISHNNGAELFEGPTIRVICQNLNGPCSLIAVCNVLILRGDVSIAPPNRPSVSYSYLSALLADYLLRLTAALPYSEPLDIEAVLSILPSTRYGLNLNPRFGGVDGFRSDSSASGELTLFQVTKVPLVHGWVVDPQEGETWDLMVEKVGDFDSAMEHIVAGDVISEGTGVDESTTEEDIVKAVSKRSQWTAEEEKKVGEAHLIRQFLDSTRTQLTYHGLFLLSTHLAPSSLSAFFRNSHLGVIYRRPTLPAGQGGGPELFTLVTDSSFANEPEVVWESLEDVDGSASDFYDGCLRVSHPRGGDFVGRAQRRRETPMEEQREWERAQDQELPQPGEDADFALAQQLQQEEHRHAQERQHEQERAARRSERRRHEMANAATGAPAVLAPGALAAGPEAVVGGSSGGRREKEKKKKDDKDKCIVM
ncbi:hypothetical protein MNV49_001980 [Pseudohyphozyma bogoriensis]|nr:hypothetical protein MNV49_001980 [Pseudohyphozyma bogoriensis]